MKELCTHGDILLNHEALSEQLKKGGPWLISMYKYSYDAITETEERHLL